MAERRFFGSLALIALASGCGQGSGNPATNVAASAENIGNAADAPAAPVPTPTPKPPTVPTMAPPPSAADLALAQTDVGKRVVKIVVDHLGVDARFVTMNASFIDNLKADSLDMVELVMACEEEFGVEVPDDAAEKILTVGDAVRYIQANKA